MSPGFSFFVPGESGQISPESPLWQRPLSGASFDFSKNIQAPGSRGPGLTPDRVPLSIGEYFTAAKTFLENDQLAAAFFGTAEKGEGDPILSVNLFLEKHGAFYHPIRVNALSETGRSASFVLNGAVSRPGLSLIEKEYRLLAGLERQVPMGYTPRVFAVGIQTLENVNPGNSNPEKKEVGFLFGEWFDGFHEFHISTRNGEQQIAVWESNGDIKYLTLKKASIIYEQIAYILTAYYNVETGEQIFPWHHAAGDFVVCPLAEDLPVKLITVRGYASLLEFDPEGAGPGEQILPALLFFFLNLTLRMQMDRLDGVGSLAFLGKIVLEATVLGFLRGLDDKATPWGGEEGMEGLKEIFIEFIAGFSLEQIEAVQTNLIEAWPANAAELTLANGHLKSHASSIHSLFKNY
jgi:hypothetical protein